MVSPHHFLLCRHPFKCDHLLQLHNDNNYPSFPTRNSSNDTLVMSYLLLCCIVYLIVLLVSYMITFAWIDAYTSLCMTIEVRWNVSLCFLYVQFSSNILRWIFQNTKKGVNIPINILRMTLRFYIRIGLSRFSSSYQDTRLEMPRIT